MLRKLKDQDDPVRILIWKLEQISGPPYAKEASLVEVKNLMNTEMNLKKFVKYGTQL